jgi:hypothetical protein
MRKLIFALILLLVVLHQDFWWWDQARPLLFGVVPIGLAWHAGISLAAGLLWLAAVTWCWPSHLDVDEPPLPSTDGARHP